MNIHEAASKMLLDDQLPDLRNRGLCYLLRHAGARRAYEEIWVFMAAVEFAKLPHYGEWTEQRLNIICLLAITTPEDFV